MCSELRLHLKEFTVIKYQCAEKNSTFNTVEQRGIVSKSTSLEKTRQ